jgi:hypothetical protein
MKTRQAMMILIGEATAGGVNPDKVKEAVAHIENVLVYAGTSEYFPDGEDGPATDQSVIALPELLDMIMAGTAGLEN